MHNPRQGAHEITKRILSFFWDELGMLSPFLFQKKRLNDNVFFAGILRQNTQNKRPKFDFKLICIQLILNHPLWKARGPLRLVLSMILIAVYHNHTGSRLHPKPRESMAMKTMKNIRLICIILFRRTRYT